MEQQNVKDMTGLDLMVWICQHNAFEMKVRVGYVTPKGDYTTSVITPGIEELEEPEPGYYVVL